MAGPNNLLLHVCQKIDMLINPSMQTHGQLLIRNNKEVVLSSEVNSVLAHVYALQHCFDPQATSL